jgi:thiamine-phosphate pyrophosphorylase
MKRPLPCVFWLWDDDRPQDIGAVLPALPRRSGLILRSRGGLEPLKEQVKKAGPWRRHHSVFVTGTPDYHAHGIHLREKERPALPLRRLRQRFLITVSCHSLSSLLRQNKRPVHGVLVSPVFATASHPGARPLGMYTLRKMMRVAQKPLIVMGGITPSTRRLLGHPHRWAGVSGHGKKTGGGIV